MPDHPCPQHPSSCTSPRSCASPALATTGAASPEGTSAATSMTTMRERLCSKVACAREAVTTLTFDYEDQMAALGPLGAGDDPHAHDLCAIHTDRLSVPRGWMVVRHETVR